jgi:hypothetical protein
MSVAMVPIRARTVWTVLIAFAVTGILPVSAYLFFQKHLAPTVTRDNANTCFQAFQATLDKGDVIIHDSYTATSVADRAYHETNGILVDGWNNPMRISAKLDSNSCELILLSAGQDGAFGTADDFTVRKTFDLSVHKPAK